MPDTYYFDASALVKYYVLEPGSTWVRSIINAPGTQGRQRAHNVSIADITIAEVTAAFAILHRTGRIRRMTWHGSFDLFMDDLTWRYDIISVNRHDFFTAASLTRTHPLKAL